MDAVRRGTMAAARLHQNLNSKRTIDIYGGNIDVFSTIHEMDLPLLLRPLQGLLGVYINSPTPGILVTTQRAMSVQRFTAAHELGHFSLKHQPSLDDEASILRRMPPPFQVPPPSDFQEIEADSFAVEFMMPRWLIHWHATRQGWTTKDFHDPSIVYQLSLRLGSSYEATCWTLLRNSWLSQTAVQVVMNTKPRDIKIKLLENHTPKDYRGDVWLLTERDAATRIVGSRNDLFVLSLKEHGGGGYLWNINQLEESGFAIVSDKVKAIDGENIGGPVVRRVTAESHGPNHRSVVLDECRPWAPTPSLSTFAIDIDLTGPEVDGFSRAERRTLLEAA